MKISTLDRYIIKKFLGTFIYALTLIIMIVVVFDISEKIDDFLESEATIKQIVFDYYLNFIPFFANLFSPLFIFISAKMALNSEIIAILSSGISFRRFLMPYFVVAILLAGATYYFNSWVIPHANKARLEFENTYIRNPFINRDRNIHRQISPGVYIYMEKYNNKYNTGYKFTMEKFKEGELVYKLSARQIRWNADLNKWSIDNYTVRHFDKNIERLERGARLDTTLVITPEDFSRRLTEIATLNDAELDKFIQEEKNRGADNIQFYLVEKHKRYAMPFATIILTLIGVSLSSRKVRGGIGMYLGIGIASCFAYILFMQISTTFATNSGFSPFISVWIPNIIFTVYGLYLLKIAPK